MGACVNTSLCTRSHFPLSETGIIPDFLFPTSQSYEKSRIDRFLVGIASHSLNVEISKSQSIDFKYCATMGSNHSKRYREINNSMSSVPSKEFQPLVEFMGALRGVYASLIEIVVKSAPICLSQREKDELNALEDRKENILRDIRLLANSLHLHARFMKSIIEMNPSTPCEIHFNDIIIYGRKVPLRDLLSEYALDCKTLAADYKDLSGRLHLKYGQSAFTKKMVGSLFIISGVLIATALIFFTVGAALPVVASAGVVVGFSLMVVGGGMLTDTEVERAHEYLNGVGTDLTKISLGFEVATLYCDERMHESVIANIDHVLKLTDEISSEIQSAILAKFK